MMSITRAGLRDLIAEKLGAIEALEDKVFTSRVWPQDSRKPVREAGALVYCNQVRRISLANATAGPTYRSTVTVTVILRVDGKREADIDDTLDDLVDAVEAALFHDPAFMAVAEEIPTITSLREMNGMADHISGQEAIEFEMRFTECFEPTLPDTLVTARLGLDAIDPFDPLGEYPDTASPFPPAADTPRGAGPDGRIEVAIDLTLADPPPEPDPEPEP